MRCFRRYLEVLSVAIGVIVFGPASSAACLAAETAGGTQKKAVWIYREVPPEGVRDTRTLTERLFAPFGYMPPERTRQIRVNVSHPIDVSERSKGTCIEYIFGIETATDWVGSYHLLEGGTAWGTKAGIDVQKLLGLKADDNVVLRFRAAGVGSVTFKIGGVDTGPHRSSMPFPREVRNSPTTLTKEFREYQIGPFPASQVTNLIDPFCVVTSGLDNSGREDIRVLVDDIRLEAAGKE